MTEQNDSIKKHEAEDFEKTITFESGQFAIVDAEIIKSLKDKIPLENKVIYVPTKQSQDVKVTYQVTAKYDDASLNQLTMTPSATNNNAEVHQMEESVQIAGHEGDSVKKKISRINRIAGQSRPKTAERSERNKRYSAKGDPKIKLTNGLSSIEARVKQKLSIKGARRDNYGQPRSKVEEECVALFKNAKNKTITEEFLNQLEHTDQIRTVLSEIRNNGQTDTKLYDLAHELIIILDKHQNHKNQEWIKSLEEDLGV